MGSEASGLVKSVIDYASAAKRESDRQKARRLQKEADKLGNPIKPPSLWPTLAARRKNTPTGPYSIEGIRESLALQTLPEGWSEEQLIDVGFEPEVR